MKCVSEKVKTVVNIVMGLTIWEDNRIQKTERRLKVHKNLALKVGHESGSFNRIFQTHFQSGTIKLVRICQDDLMWIARSIHCVSE